MGIIMYNNKIYSGGNEDILAPTPFIYSEDEQQVGIWTDGKPLYQKTYELTIPNTSGTYAFNISTPNLDKVCHTEFSVNDIGERGYTPWYTNATILFSEQTDSYIEFYFASNTYAGRKIMFTSQYTKTTDTAWQGGFKAYGFSPIIYSEIEREVGVWKDGKPLYQKTIEGTITIGVVNNIDLSSLNIDTFVSIEGVFDRDNTDFPINTFYSNSLYSFFGYNKNNHSLRAQIYADTSTGNFKTTIQYTKTTDVAGSGKYTTLGVPAVHYDNTERVIGTWFGKTLYQRTFSGLSVLLDADWVNAIDASSLNVDKCIDGVGIASSGYQTPLCTNKNGNYIQVYMNGMAGITLSEITVKYTKTS